jgi:hypothetical protein
MHCFGLGAQNMQKLGMATQLLVPPAIYRRPSGRDRRYRVSRYRT